jgi:hypothetical protein
MGALLAGLLVLGSALAAGAPRRAASGPTQIQVLSVSQSAMLRARSVSVRVRVPAARVVRLAVVGSPARTLRFRRAGARVVGLPLSAASRRALTRCSRQRLVVRAAVPWRRLVPAAGRSIRIDLSACRRAPGAGGGSSPGAAGRAGGGGGGTAGGGGGTTGGGATGGATATEGGGAGRCDDFDVAVCLQPWPNDYFTRADSTTSTGRRLDLQLLNMPKNVDEKPIDPTDMNRADGFSPGNSIVTKVPGLGTQAALDSAGVVGIKTLDAYDDPGQPIVVIDAQTGERHPVWAEIDSNPVDGSDNPDEPNRNVIIRPSRNFLDGHRYIVALRRLRNDAGDPVAPAEAFRVFRDKVTQPAQPAHVEARRPHMEALFATLADAGVPRDDLYLAWDFTVATTQNLLLDRMLKIRDHAFGLRGDTNLADLKVQGTSPEFSVTETEDFAAPDPIARTVRGTVTVPCYLFLNPQPQAPGAPNCGPGATFFIPPGSNQPLIQPAVGTPAGITLAKFVCHIPRTALTTPSRLVMYGHGLFGSRNEAGSGAQRALASEHNFTVCATDWVGMSCDPSVPSQTDPPTPVQVGAIVADPSTAGPNCDIPHTATILADVSHFPKLVDRLQQGFVNFLYMGRAMVHPSGFVSDPAFRNGAAPLIDAAALNAAGPKLYYDGNSQGGIFGGALAAIAPDLDRAVLGVPGMNYSTLLHRSVDFDAYATGKFSFIPGSPDTPVGLYDNYPNELERPLLLSLIQLLWDRADPNGYANHMTAGSPQGVLPNTPPHEVMLHLAFGDHQVANIAAEVEARTIGARTIDPYLAPATRSPYSPVVRPWGIDAFSTFPSPGSAIVMWDSGSPTPPTANTPPRAGVDPHSHPRSTAIARTMMSTFLQPGGQVTNTCGLSACYANGYVPGP